MLYNHYLILSDCDNVCKSLLSSVYGIQPLSTDSVERLMGIYHPETTEQEQLYEILKEYFLYYDVVDKKVERPFISWLETHFERTGGGNNGEAIVEGFAEDDVREGSDKTRPNPMKLRRKETPPDRETVVQWYDFYRLLTEYKTQNGLFTVKDRSVPFDADRTKNEEEMILYSFLQDRFNNTANRKRIKDIKSGVSSFANELAGRVSKMKEREQSIFQMFIVVPLTTDLESIVADMVTLSDASNGGGGGTGANKNTGNPFYDAAFTTYHENTWTIFEMQQGDYGSAKQHLQDILAAAANDEVFRMTMVGIMNMAYMQRLDAIEKLRKSFTDNANISNLLTKDTIDRMSKYPIFSRLALNYTDDPSLVQRIYARLSSAYLALFSSSRGQGTVKGFGLTKEQIRHYHDMGVQLQSYTTAIVIVDMYLNMYRAEMSELYMQKYMSLEGFWNSLYKPMSQYIWEDRVKIIMKNAFGKMFTKRSMREFDNYYKREKGGYGKFVYDAMKYIKNMYKTAPKEEEEPDIVKESNEAEDPKASDYVM